jgi:VanZ family protein
MIAWALVLFTLSSIPGQKLPSWGWLSYDKLIHFTLYVIFAFTVHRAVRNQTQFPLVARHHYLFVLIIVSLYGVSDELHQWFVPNRVCSLYDWIADTVGALVVILFDFVMRKIRPAASTVG